MRLVLLLLMVVMSGCSSTRLPSAYTGSDAGHVLLGIGESNDMRVTSYNLEVRRIEDRELPESKQKVETFAFLVGLSASRDYRTPNENGVVLAGSLEPGNYELFRYWVYLGTASGQTYYSPKQSFSIPFTVTAGQTTYLGNFQANRLVGTNFFGERVMVSPFFKVSDRSSAEFALAKLAFPLLPPPTINAVPKDDVSESVLLAR